jgi:hypothetical protein
MSTPATKDDIARLERGIAELKAMLAPVLGLAVRKQSRKERARKAGCHPATLWRRERKAKAALRVNGAI